MTEKRFSIAEIRRRQIAIAREDAARRLRRAAAVKRPWWRRLFGSYA
jgi:hypothetical protein